jgi:hypothetical protein
MCLQASLPSQAWEKKLAGHVEPFNMDDPEVEVAVPTATPTATPTANPIDLGATVKRVMILSQI